MSQRHWVDVEAEEERREKEARHQLRARLAELEREHQRREAARIAWDLSYEGSADFARDMED